MGCDLMPCPEPATWLLLALGGVVLLGAARGRRTAAQSIAEARGAKDQIANWIPCASGSSEE
jgi:hypothetical protein